MEIMTSQAQVANLVSAQDNHELRARLKNQIHCRSRREEAQISDDLANDQSLLTSGPTILGKDQSLLASAPTILRHALREAALKKTYLECLGKVGSRSETLRQTIGGLLRLQIPWQRLLRWADSAGHGGRAVKKLLSQILLELGIRQRQPGAGPKPPQEAFLIEAYVRELYGEFTVKYLRAACRVAKGRDENNDQELPNLVRDKTR